MSAYQECETIITDGPPLMAALKEMGFEPEQFEQPVPLVGYHGDERAQLAHIVVRRIQIGSASNDVGFVKESDGRYRAIISDFDSHRFNQSWLGKLTQSYAEHRALGIAKAKGYRFLGKTVSDGKVRLQFAVK